MSRLLSYFRYFLYRVNEHSLHAPLVYDVYRKVIKNARKAPLNGQIEKQKELLYRSKEKIEVTDFGIGIGRPSTRKVSDMAHIAMTPGWRSALIQNLAIYFEAKEILELGTSFGMTTLYLSRVPDAIVTTFEGCPNIANIAIGNINELQQRNIRFVKGNIDETLPAYLERSEKLDFVFFDANHAYEPTISYYEQCFKKAHDETVFIFDDIHYSAEMEKAWRTISSSVEVTLSMDLFHLGIVLFDPSLSKQHYVLSC